MLPRLIRNPHHNPNKTKATTDAMRKAPVAEREELAKLVKDSTDKNRQFFALYLGLWVYVLLMVFSTTDQMLLVPTHGIKLPLIDVTLPLLGFYWVAPLFLLAIHFNLLQNLESHHYKLMRWRDACDGTVPRWEISAFLFDYEKLEHGSRMEWLVRFGSRALFLHSGPFALGILLWRFSDYQAIDITFWHLIAFTADSYLVWLTDTAFKKNTQPDQPPLNQTANTGRFAGMRMTIALLLRLLRHLSGFALHLVQTFWRRIFGVLVLLQFGLVCWFHFSTDGFLDGWMRIRYYPSLFIPIIYIDPNDTAWVPDKKEIETQSLLAGEKDVTQWWQVYGTGLNLTGRNLRGLSASRAHLPKLTLDTDSDLRGANLSSAWLQGANLDSAQLQGIELEFAHLQGADLSGAQLQGANLSGAQLQGANLQFAQLQGGDMSIAQLQGADLSGAQLQGTDLSGAQLLATDLTEAQLQGAIVGNTAFQPSQLPDTTGVVYSEPAFFMMFTGWWSDWSLITEQAQDIPSGSRREHFQQLIEEAKSNKPLTEKQARKILLNQPNVVLQEIISGWDECDTPMCGLSRREDLLAAARGLKKNYTKFTVKNNTSLANIAPDYHSYHPEYLEKIDQAFCTSNRLTSLCDIAAANSTYKGRFR